MGLPALKGRPGATVAMAALVAMVMAGCVSKKPVVKEEKKPEPVKVEPVQAVAPLTFGKIYFAYNLSGLKAAGRESLKRAVNQLLARPDAKINIEGHCDERGTDEYNIDLGWKRAYAVRDYLKRLGVDESRMFPTSYGRARPAMTGSDESTWSKNRRVEISERK